MAVLQLPVLGAVIRFIYHVGAAVEGVFAFLFTALFRLIGRFFRFLRAFLKPQNLTASISALGARLERLGVRLGRLFSRAAIAVSRGISKDFSYWAAGLAAAGVLTFVIVSQYYTVALTLSVDGKTVGVVRQESDFTGAVDAVEHEMAGQLGENYAMASIFSSRFCVVPRSALTESETLHNNIYTMIAAEIGDHYGVYVDDVLVGAVDQEEIIQRVLDEVKAPYVTGAEGETVEFVRDVDIRCGLYPASQIMTESELAACFSDAAEPMYYTIQEDDYLSDITEKTGLSAQTLYALNPTLDDTRLVPGQKLLISQPEVYLGVRVTREVTYTESIAYTTDRIKDNTLYVNETKVKTEGKNGEKTITASVVYVDGVKESTKVLSSTVAKEPVTREIYVGTKVKASKPASSSTATYQAISSEPVQVSGGSVSFIRPISGGYISCGFGGYSGHTGIDITYRTGAYGKPVYAAAGGTVIYAQRSGGGYGNLIKIQHSNGYVTYYAHLSAINVSAGQTVSQGQNIGAIGSSGNVSGPHVHFEIRINGRAVNAARYIS